MFELFSIYIYIYILSYLPFTHETYVKLSLIDICSVLCRMYIYPMSTAYIAGYCNEIFVYSCITINTKLSKQICRLSSIHALLSAGF